MIWNWNLKFSPYASGLRVLAFQNRFFPTPVNQQDRNETDRGRRYKEQLGGALP